MISKFIKFSFNVALITFILVLGFEFSGALAQGLNDGGTGLNIPQSQVDISQSIDKRPLGDVILSMVNYFIGFLGFVAVIMFVYAGVLWVVSGGDDDQISKSKKIMTYAALGIIVIILSYSIVRFIASSAGGGGQTCSVDSDCPNNGICGEDNFCELQAEGGNTCNNNSDCSQGLSCNNGICQLPLGAVCLTSKDCGAGQYCSDQSTCKDGNSKLCNVNSDCQSPPELCDAFGFCHNSDGTSGANCSGNTDCATGYVCNLDKSICEIQGSGGQQGGENEGLTVESLDKMDQNLKKLHESFDGLDVKNLRLSPDLIDQLNGILTGSDLKEKIEALKAFKVSNGPFDSNSEDALGRLISGLEGLALTQIQLADLKTVMPETTKINTAWDEASTALNDLSRDSSSNLKLIQFETKFKTLKDLILTFPVTQSKIKVTPAQGNAPLQVVFDGLDSTDPTGGTISDYKWSFLDAAGNPQDLGNSPVVTYEFKEVGTYNVKLQVSTTNKDKDGHKLAMDGVSHVLVKVMPPSSKISFNVNDVEALDVQNVTEEEAKKGIKFDPSITVPGLGKTIVKYDWFYGDTFDDTVSKPVTMIHNYPKAGEYFVTLRVTDSQGVKDKRTIKLVIRPLAANIDISPKTGDVNTEFRFRGNKSRSDKGSINSYQWQIFDKDNAVVVESTEENFYHTFEHPGKYRVELTVGDTAGGQDKMVRDFQVMSRDPVANFNYLAPRSNHPNTFDFDASESYDPDNGDKLTYSWDFDGDGQFEIVAATDPLANYTYRRTGLFKAILQVQDAFGQRNQIEKEVKVDSILSADIQASKKAAQLGEEITFNATNSNAAAYLWEFGDGQTQSTEEDTVTHTYQKEGKYLVKLNFFDLEDNTNTVTYYILVAQGDSPIALADVSVAGRPLTLIEDLCGQGVDGYEVHRSDNIAFTGENSVNRDGSAKLLSYDWKFSDGIRDNKKDFVHRFTDLTSENECQSLDLIVRDEITGKVSQEDTLYFKVINQLPDIRDFVIEQEPDKELITPTKVKLKIIGPTDGDGQIGKYRWWYYREGFETEKLGAHSTSTPETEMVVVAQGDPGLKNKYFFVAEVIDNDNGIMDTTERFGNLSFVEVTNGPNVSPVAAFTSDKTTISAGDTVTFSSQAYDPQGEVLPNTAYQWDFDGDGAYDDTTTGSQVNHQFNTPGEYEVRLRVTNRGLSSTVRQAISVQATNSYPQASFSYSITDNTVTFKGDNSAADVDLASPTLTYAWDFDVQDDADGNGINDDDIESNDPSPSHIYGQSKLYRVKLKVKDSSGMEGISVRDVDLNLTSADRLQKIRRSIELKAQNQPITLLNLEVSPYQLEKGMTADLTAKVQNADNSTYTGSVFFELMEGTGTFSPSPVKAVDSKAQTVFTAVDPGPIRIRVTATDTYYGDLSQEIIINVQ